MHEQLELPLSAPASFDDILKRRGETDLRLTLSGRLMRGWRIWVNAFTGTRRLVVPAYLADAPTDVKEALVEWALLPLRSRGKRRAEIRRRKRALEAVVWRYIAMVRPEAVTGRRVDPGVFAETAKGVRYDLAEVRDTVNRTLLGGAVTSEVRWGRYASLTSYQTMRRAPDDSTYSLITIAGVYNHPDVPRFAIEGVMYHEMLHVLLPPEKNAGRRLVHSRRFREAERQFPRYDEWREWERTHARRLAATLRRCTCRQKYYPSVVYRGTAVSRSKGT